MFQHFDLRSTKKRVISCVAVQKTNYYSTPLVYAVNSHPLRMKPLFKIADQKERHPACKPALVTSRCRFSAYFQ
jgi:hypothetical protein